MKGSVLQNNDDGQKTTTQTKTKKGAKSRAKSTKTSTESNANSTPNSSGPKSITSTPTASVNIGNSNAANMVNAPSTPTSTLFTHNIYEGIAGSSSSSGVLPDVNIPIRNAQKNYAGLEARSVKVYWEQHDESGTEITPEVAARLAEDASYKLWELCSNLKIFARNSGGVVTYDLVNEALSEYDCPPKLGAMDSDWDRIDYDGTYFFHSDKIVELRDEYQKQQDLSSSKEIRLTKFQAVDDKYLEPTKKYASSLMNIIVNGNTRELDLCLNEVAFSPIIGSILRVIYNKVTQLLAFKQSDSVNNRCWRLLKACAFNPATNFIFYRDEIYNLSEILICQLLAPYETIKDLKGNENSITSPPILTNGHNNLNGNQTIKNEFKVMIKQETSFLNQPPEQSQQQTDTFQAKRCKLRLDNNDSDDEAPFKEINRQYSNYFGSPVEAKFVNQLCDTIGVISAENGVLQHECTHHIIRRLKRFFQGRDISTDKDYNYIGRSVRGLTALGEYSFREFIPFMYKLKIHDIPESVSHDFLHSAMYLKGHSDRYLYECLEIICGADRLQPFLIHFAHFQEKLLKYRIKHAKKITFNVVPKLGVRRLEWSSVAAAMCHGDDPNKSLKPKVSINEFFPDLQKPNLNINRPGTIRFKFAGCRPVIVKNKNPLLNQNKTPLIGSTANPLSSTSVKSEPGEFAHSDILIGRRKLYKPLSNGFKMSKVSNYYFLRV